MMNHIIKLQIVTFVMEEIFKISQKKIDGIGLYTNYT